MAPQSLGEQPLNKVERLEQLALKRRETHWPGYQNIGDFHDGVYDGAHVSPYTKGAGNVDSAIMIFLQDWVSADYLDGTLNEALATLGRDPSLPTNKKLSDLLDRHFSRALEDVYATNLFPFIKPAHMNARIFLTRTAIKNDQPALRKKSERGVTFLHQGHASAG